MSPEAQQDAIAEACGWTKISRSFPDAHPWGLSPDGWVAATPHYLTDLNAMHEAEETLGNDEITWGKYSRHLFDIIEPHRHSLHATAAQKAKSFLLTLGKLDDSK